MFFKGEISEPREENDETVIFPFGSNLSQIGAVNNAITSNVSIIEGPPGTGKTQTILNIIANAIIRNKTVAIVSNNNSATDNVYEKLEKYELDYIAAQLGNKDNKDRFIAEKQKDIPVLEGFAQTENVDELKKDISTLEQELKVMYEKQNRGAKLKQELASFKLEQQYFDENFNPEYKETDIFRNIKKVNSKKISYILADYEVTAGKHQRITLFLKIKSILFYGIKKSSLIEVPLINIISILERDMYRSKIKEIENEIEQINENLKDFSFEKAVASLCDKSLLLFKGTLAKKYSKFNKDIKFNSQSFNKNTKDFLKRYPVILSTTHSLRNSLNNVIYDYVIVDESSQVDLITGVLAMSVAKNIVVVGDLMQLPNIIKVEHEDNMEKVSKKLNIEDKYKYEKNSLLSAVCKVFEKAPRTLLKEHYRCHPKIINFCNQKFYNNELVIMTTDNGEKDVLGVTITVEGNHARGHINQRQIDEIKENIIPELNSNSLGIIAPYRAQTERIDNQTEELDIDVSTVYKFQGREKDDIIISTVDNAVTEFTDNPNMLNVAVSRAKNRLRLVVSNNEKNENTNIGDLIKYIEYNKFEVKKGDVSSVFDLLYKCHRKELEERLSKYKKVSEHASENLMYTYIKDIIDSNNALSNLDIVVHKSLSNIIRNTDKLEDEDEKEYVLKSFTHVDFLIYNKMNKSLFLVVEVDGYDNHKEGTHQAELDKLKDSVLKKYNIPFLRFKTIGSGEKEILENEMLKLVGKNNEEKQP